jgi:ADP-ribose pyrophosphatase
MGTTHAPVPHGVATVNERAKDAEVPWEQQSSRQVYQNQWISLREDIVTLPNGRTTLYGVITCSECVGVLPFLDPRTVLMIKQYRYVARRVTWEMPTGGMHYGESAETAAQRELSEEIGYRAEKLTWLSTFHTSKSVLDETAHVFVGEELVNVELQPDETEFIEVRPFSFQEVLQMVLRSEITDSMTVIAVLHAARQRGF